MPNLKDIYKKYVPSEARFWLYKMRHYSEVESLKHTVFPSEKGDFSLRRYYQNKAIFVHITKAAGTSLALSLFGELPYHYTAQQYRVIFGRKHFNNCFKFTFVRNPWDRLYSAYSYLTGGGWNEDDANWARINLSNVKDFNDFVMNWLTEEKLNSHIHLRPQHKFICDRKNKPIIDYIGYFETIQEDFDNISNKLGLTNKNLKHTNASKRAGYREIYTQDSIKKVYDLYKFDIVSLGYQFDGLHRKTVLNRNFVDYE